MRAHYSLWLTIGLAHSVLNSITQCAVSDSSMLSDAHSALNRSLGPFGGAVFLSLQFATLNLE